MLAFLHLVDRISTKVGHIFAWTIVLLTGVIVYEVFTRYVLNSPNPWVFDVSYILYGILFMMAGAYTLATNGHVRGDILYGFLEPRTQAILDLILYFVFFFPGIIALTYAGYTFADEAWAIKEMSSITADGPPIYPFKAFIPPSVPLLTRTGDHHEEHRPQHLSPAMAGRRARGPDLGHRPGR